MGWLAKQFEKFRKLPGSVMVAHITSKFVFGVGVGLLVAAYLKQYDWQLWGWIVIILSIVLGLPGAYKLLKK